MVGHWFLPASLAILAMAGTVGVLAWLFHDPPCPGCGHRLWSKGIGAWRCRHCRATYDPVRRIRIIAGLRRPLHPKLGDHGQ